MKRIVTMFLLAVLLMAAVNVNAQEEYTMLETLHQATYHDRFYMNPQALSSIGDPFILKEVDTYYCYATGGSSGFYMWQTDDLSNWGSAKRTHVFEGSSWATKNYWAPEVHKYKDKYVLMYSAQWENDYKLRLGIAFADSPEGPFVDPLDKPLLRKSYCAIDAHLFVDDDGTPYLFYVRDNYDNFIGKNQVSQTYGVQLSEDLLSIVGEPVLLTTPENDWELKSGKYIWNEGVYVLKNNGKYYLYFSANYTSTHDYCVGVAVSDNVLGPYVKPVENPLLAPTTSLVNGNVIVSGPGHNAFFTVGDELFTSYHVNTSNENPMMNRTLCIDRAGFHEDGTAYINGVSLKKQLLSLEDIGLVNATKMATIISDDDAELLRDGDYCISEASVNYLWHGTQATLTWENAITSDMLMIYPQRGMKETGKVIINEQYYVDINLASIGSQPGAAVILSYKPMEITSCRVTWDQETALGEIIVLAHPTE